MLKSAVVAIGAVALCAPALAQQGGRGGPPPPPPGTPVFTELTSWAEGPLQGNATASGDFTGVVNTNTSQFCYLYNVVGLDAVTGVAIQMEGSNNPALDLQPPADGASGGCVPIAANLAQQMIANPANYRVVIRTQTFPNGALHGRLAA